MRLICSQTFWEEHIAKTRFARKFLSYHFTPNGFVRRPDRGDTEILECKDGLHETLTSEGLSVIL